MKSIMIGTVMMIVLSTLTKCENCEFCEFGFRFEDPEKAAKDVELISKRYGLEYDHRLRTDDWWLLRRKLGCSESPINQIICFSLGHHFEHNPLVKEVRKASPITRDIRY